MCPFAEGVDARPIGGVLSRKGGTPEITRVPARQGIWVLCLASLALLAGLSAVAAPALASARSRPSVVVVSAAANGSDTLKVTVPVKKGKGCGGKVTISAGRVHAHANLSAHNGVCQALLHLKLPKADFGKVIAFSVRIAGAEGVSHFASTVHLHLVPPPPPSQTPTTPTTPVGTPAGPSLDGTYRSLLKAGREGNGEVWAEGEMIVKGGQITNVGLIAGGGVVAVECTGGPSKSTGDFSPIAPLISEAIGNGMFSAVYMTHLYRVEFSGTLKYDPATQKPYGGMSFSMTGKSEGFTCGKEAHGASMTYTP